MVPDSLQAKKNRKHVEATRAHRLAVFAVYVGAFLHAVQQCMLRFTEGHILICREEIIMKLFLGKKVGVSKEEKALSYYNAIVPSCIIKTFCFDTNCR